MANLSQLIARAQSLCEQRGVRLTAQRERVYEIIVQSKRAISAYDLLDVLRETEPQAKPPTVYRALDFLLSQGVCAQSRVNQQFYRLLLAGA